MKKLRVRRAGFGRAAGAAGLWVARHVLPFLLSGAAAGLAHLGMLRLDTVGIALVSCSSALLVALVVREILMGRKEKLQGARKVMRELRMLVPAAAVLQLWTIMARSSNLELGALNYLFTLVAVTFFSRGASIPAVLADCAIEWVAIGGPDVQGTDFNRRLAASTFLMFFAIFGIAFLRTEIVRLRAKGRERIEEQLDRITQLARDYRLMSAPSSQISEESPEERDDEEERRRALQSVTASLNEIHSTIFAMLDVVRRSMRLHTCVLLWKEDTGEYLRILEAATDSTLLAESSIPVQFGVTGVVASHGKHVSFCPFNASTTPLPYYHRPEPVMSFCALPVIEDRVVRGVLCADRLTEDPFTDQDREILEAVAAQAIRIVNNERVFLQLAKSKTEQSRLYRASTRLRAANSCDEVLSAAFESARSIVAFELAVATSYDPESRRHTVIRADGLWAEQLSGLAFGDNDGLVAQSVRMRYHLPYKGQYDPVNMSVFTRRVKFKGARSLLVMPLVVRDRAVGTLVLASKRERVFSLQARPLLLVIADQTALSYQNALMVSRLEELATTDGLTGLHNKRVFIDALGRKLLAALRFDKKLSLIMTDLDRFKSVNDTYGHQVGDEVLRRFASVLARNARQVDMACRYGGEEFVIICEETDAEGAWMLAERIRMDMQRESFSSDKGAFAVTCSLGVATAPAQGDTPDELIRNADEALYQAKHSGRNCVVTSQAGLRKTG